MPENAKGIDVSHFQGAIDWKAVKGAGVSFAYAKCSGDRDDPQFAANWKGMKRAGVVRGAYLFLMPQLDPVTQADRFLNLVQQAGGWEKGRDLPHCLDVETFRGRSPAGMVKLISECAKPLEDAMGRRVVIYCSRGQWDESVGGGFEGHPLWIANYTTAPQPTLAKAWKSWVLWQYSDHAHYAGVNPGADADYFNGDLAALEAFIQ